MQTRDRFPVDACTGGDFVTGRYEVAAGERVVDLDTDLDALPAWGRLCVHEQTVRLMMTALGWEYEENAIRKIKDQAAEINRLRKENAGFRKAMEAMIGAAHDAALNIEQFLEPAT